MSSGLAFSLKGSLGRDVPPRHERTKRQETFFMTLLHFVLRIELSYLSS